MRRRRASVHANPHQQRAYDRQVRSSEAMQERALAAAAGRMNDSYLLNELLQARGESTRSILKGECRRRGLLP